MTKSLATSNHSISTIQRLKASITSTQVASTQKEFSTLMSLPTTTAIPWSISTLRQQSSLQHRPMFFAVHLQLSVRNRLRVVPTATSTVTMVTRKVLSTTRRPVTISSSTTTPIGSVTHVTRQHKDMATYGRTRHSPSLVLI